MGTEYVEQIKLAVATNLTIATGIIAPTQENHTLTGEGGAGVADTLITITKPNVTDGDRLFLRLTAAAGVITITDAGNITLPGGRPIQLSVTSTQLELFYDAVATKWKVIASVFTARNSLERVHSVRTISSLTGTGVEQAFTVNQYTIPADTLVVGSVIKIRARLRRTAQNAADTTQYTLRIGGLAGTLLAQTAAIASAANAWAVLEAEIIVAGVGVGSIKSDGTATNKATTAAGAATATQVSANIPEVNFTTTIDNTIVVTQIAPAGGNTDDLESLEVFIG